MHWTEIHFQVICFSHANWKFTGRQPQEELSLEAEICEITGLIDRSRTIETGQFWRGLAAVLPISVGDEIFSWKSQLIKLNEMKNVGIFFSSLNHYIDLNTYY